MKMAESFPGLTAHMRQELLLLDQEHRMGGRAVGAQAALSEVRREAELLGVNWDPGTWVLLLLSKPFYDFLSFARLSCLKQG